MDNMYDILAKMDLLEGQKSKPDFLDLDKDGDRKEPMKKAAREKTDEAIEEGSTGDYSAKKARAGKDIGKPGKAFAKIAKDAGERYGSKERGEKVAGAVLAKLRKGATESVEEAAKPDYIDLDKDGDRKEPMKKAAQDKKKKMKESMALVKVLESGERRAEIFVDREYDEYQVRLHQADLMARHFTDGRGQALRVAQAFVNEALDINLLKSIQKGAKPGIKDPESERNIHKKYGYRSDTEDDTTDDDYDEFGNLRPGAKKKSAHVIPGEKRGRGRPKGSGGGKRLGAKATGLSKLARAGAIKEADIEEDDDIQRPRNPQALDYQEGPEDDEQYRRHHGIDDPDRRRERKLRATDHKTLDRLERGAIEKAKQPMGEDYDKDEYDEEGEMAQSQARSIEDAAQELQSILDADENLPEWVQKKITLAQEYIDSARDYLKANPEDDEMSLPEDAHSGFTQADWNRVVGLKRMLMRMNRKLEPEDAEQMAAEKLGYDYEDVLAWIESDQNLEEKAVSKAQRRAAGIAHAARKGDIPKSELRGASKEMSDMPTKELKKFAKTKEKDLPAKKDESVEETTTAGSVATSDEAPKSKKGGMQFGKGVYESRLEESFKNRMQKLDESMNVSMNASTEGQDSLTVTATDEDAAKLGELLKLAGLFSSSGYQRMDDESTCSECGGAGMHEAGCGQGRMVEEELANTPEPAYAELGDTKDYGLAGGVNGPKLQINPNNMGDNPMAMRDLGKAPSGQVNLGAMAEQVELESQQRMLDLYKRIS